jgi:hypothetical protein
MGTIRIHTCYGLNRKNTSQTVDCSSSISEPHFLYQLPPTSSYQSSMSSFRNHRIVIASLFLPTIAVIEESAPPTPEGRNLDSTIYAVADRLAVAVDPTAKSKPFIITNNHHRQPSASSPLKSIVEDLKDKVSYSSFETAIITHSYSSEPLCNTQSVTN